MQNLKTNMINLHGQRGRSWLDSLPQLTTILAQQWSLTDIQAVNNLSWNYIAFAMQHETPVALKISYDADLLQREYATLKHFNGQGAIKTLALDETHQAMLLQRALPGESLKQAVGISHDEKIKMYAQLTKSLIRQNTALEDFQHVSEWCETIDRIQSDLIAQDYLQLARRLKEDLLSTITHPYVCHGDLHFDNVIQDGDNWLVIDPKGIIGELAFEAAAADLTNEAEASDINQASALIKARVASMAKILAVNEQRLLAWIFVRIIISAQWFIEDNGDPSRMLHLAACVYPLLYKFKNSHNNC